jgi:hypothetical protein
MCFSLNNLRALSSGKQRKIHAIAVGFAMRNGIEKVAQRKATKLFPGAQRLWLGKDGLGVQLQKWQVGQRQRRVEMRKDLQPETLSYVP